MANVRFDRQHTYAEALAGNSGTIYFTTDTKDIVLDGSSYSTRRVPGTSISITKNDDDSYTTKITGIDAIRDSGEYLCYAEENLSNISTMLFKLTVKWQGTEYKQIIYPNPDVSDLNPATDYIYRTVNADNTGITSDWIVVKDDHNVTWND